MSILSTHDSHWRRHSPLVQRYDALQGSHATEVLVIGAGITGLSTALELLERGHKVAVCDAETVGMGTSGASSGHLDAHPEMGTVELIERLGEDDAREYTQLRLDAIRKVSSRAGDEAEFVNVPAYFYTESTDQKSSVRKAFEAAGRLGLQVSWLDHVPLPKAFCGYQLENFGRMDSLKYVHALASQVIARGGKIFEKTLVAGPAEVHPTALKCSGGTVAFKQVVCAVHCNHTDSLRLYLETPPYQSYCLVAKVTDPPIDGLFWDDADPYHYTRRVDRIEENRILVGGCDHRTGAGDEVQAHRDLEQWVRSRFQVEEIVSRWSAELFEPTDGLPLIGKVAGKENVWIATGLSGVGLTLGTAAGEILAQLIDDPNKSSSLLEKLSPARFGMSDVTQFVSEQATSARNYAERVLPAKNVDLSELQPGQGVVGNLDGEFIAVCRDRSGEVHRQSPICVHMGGVVHWNEAEQTWDCPVHGGRYCSNGARLYGPPEDRLEKR